jgi:hypothetical protein
MNKVPDKLYTVLRPLIKEIEEFNETLDKDEFIESCINLLQTLTVAERNILIN